jgi:hypothetical protein
MKKLTPEQEARQNLVLDALKEKSSYERLQRRKIAKCAKDTISFALSLIILAIVSVLLFSL